MENKFSEYCLGLFNNIPYYVYLLLVIILCAGIVLIIRLMGTNNGWKYALTLLLSEYCFFLLCSTVIFRSVLKESSCHFMPFWSYYPSYSEQFTIMPEHIMNIVVFIPVGILCCILWGKMSLLKAFMFGCLFSCLIEMSQYVFKRGVCEIDDVINNTIGCLLGASIVCVLRKMLKCLNN